MSKRGGARKVGVERELADTKAICICYSSNKKVSGPYQKNCKKSNARGTQIYSKTCLICSREYVFHDKCAKYYWTKLTGKNNYNWTSEGLTYWKNMKFFCWECQTTCVCGKEHNGKETSSQGKNFGGFRAACYSQNCQKCPKGPHWFFSLQSCLKEKTIHLRYKSKNGEKGWDIMNACGYIRESEYIPNENCNYRKFIKIIITKALDNLEKKFDYDEDFNNHTYNSICSIRAAMMIVYRCVREQPNFGPKTERPSLVKDIRSILHRIEYLFSIGQSYMSILNVPKIRDEEKEIENLNSSPTIQITTAETRTYFMSRFNFLCGYENKDDDWKKVDLSSKTMLVTNFLNTLSETNCAFNHTILDFWKDILNHKISGKERRCLNTKYMTVWCNVLNQVAENYGNEHLFLQQPIIYNPFFTYTDDACPLLMKPRIRSDKVPYKPTYFSKDISQIEKEKESWLQWMKKGYINSAINEYLENHPGLPKFLTFPYRYCIDKWLIIHVTFPTNRNPTGYINTINDYHSCHEHGNLIDMMIKENCRVFFNSLLRDMQYEEPYIFQIGLVYDDEKDHLTIPLVFETNDLSNRQLVTIQLMNLLYDPIDIERLHIKPNEIKSNLRNTSSISDGPQKIYLSRYICNAFDLQLMLFQIDIWMEPDSSSHKDILELMKNSFNVNKERSLTFTDVDTCIQRWNKVEKFVQTTKWPDITFSPYPFLDPERKNSHDISFITKIPTHDAKKLCPCAIHFQDSMNYIMNNDKNSLTNSLVTIERYIVDETMKEDIKKFKKWFLKSEERGCNDERLDAIEIFCNVINDTSETKTELKSEYELLGIKETDEANTVRLKYNAYLELIKSKNDGSERGKKLIEEFSKKLKKCYHSILFLNLKQRLLDKKSSHEILNLDENATRKDIIDSYKSLSLVYHPDKTSDFPTKCVALTTEIFRIIKASRDVLCEGKNIEQDELKYNEKEEKEAEEEERKEKQQYSRTYDQKFNNVRSGNRPSIFIDTQAVESCGEKGVRKEVDFDAINPANDFYWENHFKAKRKAEEAKKRKIHDNNNMSVNENNKKKLKKVDTRMTSIVESGTGVNEQNSITNVSDSSGKNINPPVPDKDQIMVDSRDNNNSIVDKNPGNKKSYHEEEEEDEILYSNDNNNDDYVVSENDDEDSNTKKDQTDQENEEIRLFGSNSDDDEESFNDKNNGMLHYHKLYINSICMVMS